MIVVPPLSSVILFAFGFCSMTFLGCDETCVKEKYKVRKKRGEGGSNGVLEEGQTR